MNRNGRNDRRRRWTISDLRSAEERKRRICVKLFSNKFFASKDGKINFETGCLKA